MKLFHHRPFKGQELKLGGMVFGLSSFQLLTSKSYRVVLSVVSLLQKYSTQSLSGGISFQPEEFLEICEDQDRYRHAFLFEIVESLKSLRREFQLLILQFASFTFQEVI